MALLEAEQCPNQELAAPRSLCLYPIALLKYQQDPNAVVDNLADPTEERPREKIWHPRTELWDPTAGFTGALTSAQTPGYMYI